MIVKIYSNPTVEDSIAAAWLRRLKPLYDWLSVDYPELADYFRFKAILL